MFKSKSAKVDKSAQRVKTAFAICQTYWGSNGSPEAFASARSQLRAMKLTDIELHDVRDEIPAVNEGTTGHKVANINQFLKRLEKEAA